MTPEKGRNVNLFDKTFSAESPHGFMHSFCDNGQLLASVFATFLISHISVQHVEEETQIVRRRHANIKMVTMTNEHGN